MEVLKELSANDNIRVVVLTGTGEHAFVAGADISKMEEMTSIQIFRELPAIQRVVWELETLSTPTIARVNGIALGGDTELALVCDKRVTSQNAVLVYQR